jgi:hypothetical protein
MCVILLILSLFDTNYVPIIFSEPIPEAARSKASDCPLDFGCACLAIAVRLPPATWMQVCRECYLLSCIGLRVGLIIRPEESYRVICVSECDKMQQ